MNSNFDKCTETPLGSSWIMEELGEIGFERSTYSHLLALGEVKGSETLMIWITQIAVQMNDPSDKHGGSVVSMIDIPSFSPHDM